MRAPAIGERLGARRGLAILTVFAVVAAMFLLYSGTARADHVSTVPHSSDANNASWWEQWGADEEGEDDWICEKLDEEWDDPYTLGSPGSGFVWRLLVTKKGSGDGANELHWNPVPGGEYEHSGGGFSHLILCKRPVDITTPTTTPTTEATTVPTTTPTTEATTVPTTTPTTTPTTEATTVPTTTPTTVVDEVLPTVVTTAPEVGEESELPFTGLDTEVMIGLSVLFLALGAVLLTITRRLEEN